MKSFIIFEHAHMSKQQIILVLNRKMPKLAMLFVVHILQLTFYNSEHFSLSVLKQILVIRAGIHKMLVRIANREGPV